MGHTHAFLLLLGLALSLQASASLALNAQVQQIPQPHTYLFPILRYGPNNQKRDLRHTLAIAKATGSGIILPGIYKHYKDIFQKRQEGDVSAGTASCFVERRRNFMEFHEVLDRSSIESWLPVASVQELKARGWDGKLDAVIHMNRWWEQAQRDINKSFAANAVGTGPDTRHFSMQGFLNCKESALMDMRQKLSSYRYVGILFIVLGAKERPNIALEPIKPPNDGCMRTIYEANRALRPAAWLDELASRYIQAHIGQGQSYLALHVRPYPDTCIEMWKQGQFEPARLKTACIAELSNLHQRIAPCALQLMAAHQLNKVFVMAHPVLHTVVKELFGKVGIEPLFLDSQRLMQLAGCADNSATFLAMVEEQLAVHAHTLLGTATSSITHTIVYQRLGMGNIRNVYFETLQCGAPVMRPGQG